MSVKFGETYWKEETERFLFAVLQESTDNLIRGWSDGQGETKENSQQILHAGSTCSGTIVFCGTSLYGQCVIMCVCDTTLLLSVLMTSRVMETTNSQLLLFTDFTMTIDSMKASKICHTFLLYKMTVSNEKFHIGVRGKNNILSFQYPL